MSSGAEIKNIDLLYDQYQAAIANANVEDILTFGELYYSARHNGKMTKEDREKLQRDVMVCVIRNRDV